MSGAIKKRYLAEVAIQLQQQGLRTRPAVEDELPVEVGGVRICTVTSNGGVRYRPDTVSEAEKNLIEGQVSDIAQMVKEYMAMMEAAPQLKASGLEGDYRALAEFNSVVLAGHPTKYGVQFVTWEWVQDHTSLWQGHYTDSYSAAKKDFATRAGLLAKERIFNEQQLTEVYRSIYETLESGYPLTREREQTLTGIAAQIEQTVPNLDELVQESNEEEMIQGKADGPEMIPQF